MDDCCPICGELNCVMDICAAEIEAEEEVPFSRSLSTFDLDAYIDSFLVERDDC